MTDGGDQTQAHAQLLLRLEEAQAGYWAGRAEQVLADVQATHVDALAAQWVDVAMLSALLMAKCHYVMRHFAACVDGAQLAVDLALRLQDRTHQAAGWVLQAVALARLRRIRSAIDAAMKGVSLLDASVPPREAANCYVNVGLAYSAMGLFAQELEAMRSAYEMDSHSDVPVPLRFLRTYNLIDAMARTHTVVKHHEPEQAQQIWSQVQTLLLELNALADQIGPDAHLASADLRGRCHLWAGEYQAVVDLTMPLLALSDTGEVHEYRLMDLLTLAAYSLSRLGRDEEALACAERAQIMLPRDHHQADAHDVERLLLLALAKREFEHAAQIAWFHASMVQINAQALLDAHLAFAKWRSAEQATRDGTARQARDARSGQTQSG